MVKTDLGITPRSRPTLSTTSLHEPPGVHEEAHGQSFGLGETRMPCRPPAACELAGHGGQDEDGAPGPQPARVEVGDAQTHSGIGEEERQEEHLDEAADLPPPGGHETPVIVEQDTGDEAPEDRVDPERLGQCPGREHREQDDGHEVAGEAAFIETRPPEDPVQGRAQEPPGHRAKRANQRDTQAQLRTGETREGEGRDRAEQEPADHVGDRGRRDGDGADAGAVEVELESGSDRARGAR